MAMISDLGSIPEVTVDFKLQNIVPKSNVDAEMTLRVLKEKHARSENGWWGLLQGQSPKSLAKKEYSGGYQVRQENNDTEVFLPLQEIYADIVSST